MKLAGRAAAWLCFALFWVQPWRGLVGHPDADLWNHAWGFHWFQRELAQGQVPWFSTDFAAPGGGVLYFIDPLGALLSWPFAAAFGAAAGWNAVAVLNVAVAGASAQLLAEEVLGEDPPGWLAGLAYATMPMLLCELHNGISEATAVHWLPLSLWAALKAVRDRGLGAYLRLGVLGGLSALGSVYYGLLASLLASGVLLAHWRRLSLSGLVAATLAAGVIAGPALLTLRASLDSERAVIVRSEGLNRTLAEHNAVDPRVYVAPGRFQSVNLADRYGESLIHTGYLRLSLLGLAIWALWQAPRRLGGWASLAAFSLALGLGPYLFVEGALVRTGGGLVPLPFRALQWVLPEVALTHPLRLALGGQLLVGLLAAAALHRRPRWVAGAAAVVVAAEGAFGSLPAWPVPASPAAVPAVYEAIASNADSRAVLDLPGDVGATMATSVYFWHQTAHLRPLPYRPDAKIRSMGDDRLRRMVPVWAGGLGQEPLRRAHLEEHYGWVLLHRKLAARTPQPEAWEPWLAGALGPAETHGDVLLWRLPEAPR